MSILPINSPIHLAVLQKQIAIEGPTYVENKLIEEMGELIQALMKQRVSRSHSKRELREKVLEELAHVNIRITQFLLHLNSSDTIEYQECWQSKIHSIAKKCI